MSEYSQVIIIPRRFAKLEELGREEQRGNVFVNADLVIGVWDGSRQAYLSVFRAPGVQPLGKIDRLIPRAPDEADNLLDALLALYPQAFDACPSMPAVRRMLARNHWLDLDRDGGRLRTELWPRLREEARPIFLNQNFTHGVLQHYGPKWFGGFSAFNG